MTETETEATPGSLSTLDEIRRKYDNGELAAVKAEPKADALIVAPFFILDDRGDPAQLKDWTMADLWLGKSGRLYHDTEDPGRPNCLFRGIRGAAALRTRILASNECVRDHAVELSLAEDSPWFPAQDGDKPLPAVLVAAQDEETLQELVNAMIHFRGWTTVDEEEARKGATVLPKKSVVLEDLPPTPAHKVLTSPTRLRPGTLPTEKQKPDPLKPAAAPAAERPALSPEEEKLAMAKRRQLQDSLLKKYQAKAKRLDGKRHLNRDEFARHGHEKGRAVWAEAFGVADFNEADQRCGAFRDNLSSNGDDFFEGEFHHGMRHGRGVWQFKGCSYDGVWRFDKPDGQGCLKEAEGTTLDGEWKNGHLHGKGKISDLHGNLIYDGTFKHGRRDGLGKQVFENGDEYEGDWKDGRMHGHGCQTFRNGDKFVGAWEDGVYHGDGTMYFADGSFSRRSYVNGRLEETQDYRTEQERFQPIYTRIKMQAHTRNLETPIWAKDMDAQVALRY